MSTYKFLNGDSYDMYLPYGVLGSLLLCPGIYYTSMLFGIWLNYEGYDYECIPNISEDY